MESGRGCVKELKGKNGFLDIIKIHCIYVTYFQRIDEMYF